MAESYEDFVEKFKPKKTTDDCYTPPAVYAAVLDWIRARVDLTGRQIVRPFYPGGDYERADYPPGCVVIDNPPFSLMRKIVVFYLSRGISFFLFAPALQLFQRGLDGITYIIPGGTITYENGANVATAFCSSLFPGIRIMLAGTLGAALTAAKQPPVSPPPLELPPSVVTPACLRRYIVPGADLEIPAAESTPSVPYFGGRKLFGGAIFLSAAQASRLEESRELAERQRAEKTRARTLFLEPTPEEAHALAMLNSRRK